MVNEELRGWSLTDWEWHAIGARFNLATGQPEGISLPRADETAQLFAELLKAHAVSDAANEVFHDYVEVFSQLTSQSMNRTAGDPLLHYSASQAIEVAAHTLRRSGVQSVAVMSPTFDFIPALLRRCGLEAIGLPESQLTDLDAVGAMEVEAYFLILPNNPTGQELDEPSFRGFLELAVAAERSVICDFSLRGYGSTLYDHYQLLRESGVDYLTIEDSGKWWPLGDLKVGMLVSSEKFHQVATKTSRESLLSVPTVVVQTLTSMMSRSIADEQIGGLSDRDYLRGIVKENRALLRSRLRGPEFVVRTRGGTLNVEWIELGGVEDSTEFCFEELSHGVAVLPGSPFFWDRNMPESPYLRMALLRDTEDFGEAVTRFLEIEAGRSRKMAT